MRRPARSDEKGGKDGEGSYTYERPVVTSVLVEYNHRSSVVTAPPTDLRQ